MALVVVLANVFQKEIAHVFAKHIPGVPSDFNGTKAGKDFSNPFEDIIHRHLGQRMILAVDPFPLPPGDDSPFPWPAISTSSAVLSQSTTSMPSTVSTSISSRISPTPTSSSTQSETPSPLADPANLIPHSPGLDEYHLYTGNGTIAAGWPHKADWMSFSDMYLPFHSPPSFPSESTQANPARPSHKGSQSTSPSSSPPAASST